MSENQGSGTMAGSGAIVGFVLGAVIGAGVALLLAPASGSDTRRRLKEKAEELRGKAEHLTEGARTRLHEVGDAVRGGARDLTNAVKEGRDAFQKASEDPVSQSKRL